jgi:hypothetical protein
MKIFMISVIGTIFCILFSCKFAHAQLPYNDPNSWTLVWSDEFNYQDFTNFGDKNFNKTPKPTFAYWELNDWGTVDPLSGGANKEFLTNDGHNLIFHPDPNFNTSSADPNNSWMSIM